MSTATESDFCYVTLAFGAPYRKFARELAGDLSKQAPGKILVVGTDAPEEFGGVSNIQAIRCVRQGLFRCINDKRFPMEAALKAEAHRAVFLDADTRIHSPLPSTLEVPGPLLAAQTPNLEEQASQFLSPDDRRLVLDTARAFGIDPAAHRFVWDNLFSVARDERREQVFFQIWGLVTTFFDFQGHSITDGYCMSIAAAVTGWTPHSGPLAGIDAAREHIEIHGMPRGSLPERILARAKNWLKWRRFRAGLLRRL